MKFETLILLIIAFNVVTAILQRRAKKAKEAAKQKAAQAAAQSMRPPQPSAAKPAPVDWSEAEDGEDGFEENWEDAGEHQHSRHDQPDWEAGEHEPSAPRKPSSGSEAASREEEARRRIAERLRREREESRRPAEERPKSPAPSPAEIRQKATSLGKDLLEQLAKELGLKLPQPESPKPAEVSRPQASVPAASSAPAVKPAPELPRPAERSAAPARPAAKPFPLPNLNDPRKAREAVVLREIIGPPLWMRRR